MSDKFKVRSRKHISGNKVKTANRKRIALAAKTLSELDEPDRKNIFKYIPESNKVGIFTGYKKLFTQHGNYIIFNVDTFFKCFEIC